MVAIPQIAIPDPTLAAADEAMRARSRQEPKRTYLGMSVIGHACGRRLWYDFHTDAREEFDAETLKRFDDGHRSEDVLAARLRMVPGITLLTVDPDTGRQFRFEDFEGRFAGHPDGFIRGLLQAPAAWHVWEAKCVQEKKLEALRKLKYAPAGEKAALAVWDPVYFSQAQAYMGYAELSRHYLTVCTPGARDWDSVRTEFDPVIFEQIKDKARRIIEARAPLAKLSQDSAWWQCRFCGHRTMCHGLAVAA